MQSDSTLFSIIPNVPKNPLPSGSGYNPRCIYRDVNADAALDATADRAFALIQQSKDINTFYNTLLTPPRNVSDLYNWGIHTAGYYIAGGNPGGDPMANPGDPIFYFHYAALDRLWWIWQMQDPDTRVNAQVTLGGANGASRKLNMKWLTADVIPVLEAHDGLGGYAGTSVKREGDPSKSPRPSPTVVARPGAPTAPIPMACSIALVLMCL